MEIAKIKYYHKTQVSMLGFQETANGQLYKFPTNNGREICICENSRNIEFLAGLRTSFANQAGRFHRSDRLTEFLKYFYYKVISGTL